MSKAELRGKINLDSSGFSNGLTKAKASVKSFASGAIASFVRIGATFAGISLVKSIVNLGLAAGETASKFEAVFGPATDSMNAKVQELRKTIPSTTAEVQDALATFAAMAQGFGLNAEAASLFSIEMVKIGGDIASFHNLPIEEAFLKIRSAISGEFEPLKSLGIVIDQATIKQEGFNIGVWDGVGAMGAAQKALAVQSIMIRNLGTANGDAAATADSAANRVKFLRAELMETGTKIGTTALPAILALTEGLSLYLKTIQDVANFLGTVAGQMIYGADDATMKKRQEEIDAYNAKRQAIEELTASGELYKQGMFEGKWWTDGLSEKLEENKRLIAERTKEIIAGSKATKIAAEADDAAAEEAIKNAQDLSAEFTKQIEIETDPVRKQALIDRKAAHERLLVVAGKLASQEAIAKARTEKQLEDDADKVRLAEKQLALIKAQASQDAELTIEAQSQLDLEQSIQRIMKSTNVTREEATKLAIGLSQEQIEANAEKARQAEDEVRLAELHLDLLKAQAAEDTELTHEATKQLELEESIQSIMKSTNVDRATAVQLAKDLAAANAGADRNQSGYTTPREQRAEETRQRKRDKEQRVRESLERIAETSAGERQRKEERDERFTARETASGYGPGSESKSEPKGNKPSSGDNKDVADMNTNIKSVADNTKEMLNEIQKNPS
jgi:hypothetical protein